MTKMYWMILSLPKITHKGFGKADKLSLKCMDVEMAFLS